MEETSRKGAKRAKERCGLFVQVIDDTLDPVPQQLDVEVDEESESKIGESEMGQELLRVHRSDALHRFQLDAELGFNDQVGAESLIEDDIAIANRYRHLALHLKATVTKLEGKSGLVDRLKETGPESAGPRVRWTLRAASTTSFAISFSVMSLSSLRALRLCVSLFLSGNPRSKSRSKCPDQVMGQGQG